MSTNTTPSAGAVRAVTAMLSQCSGNIGSMAEIIDRETGAARLADALERYIAESEGFMCDMVGDPDPELDEARAALAEWRENNQTP